MYSSDKSGIDDSSADKRLRVQITEVDLLCVNGCGFYGTPQWKGRCSKCWRLYQVEQKRTQDYAKNRELLNIGPDNRRKLSSDSRSLKIKSLLRRSTAAAASHSDASQVQSQPLPIIYPVSSRQRHLSEESRVVRDNFHGFLTKNLPPVIAHEIQRQGRHAISKIIEQRKNNVNMDDLSAMVQHFYQVLADKIQFSSHFKEANVTVSVEEVMAEIERYICVRAYVNLFCAIADEEVADLSLQERIRSLHWVTSGFLETKLDFSQQSVQDKLDDAVTEIIDMNSHRGAAEKLQCLVRCSKMIFEALKESRSGAPASADEYLPVLIYILLKGNPPLIQSNVKFISRFALPSRVMSGESGYYFTNLSCALQFVQNMNAESLKMPKEEFEAYTCGQRVPPISSDNWGCNQAIRCMENTLSQMRDLLNRQKDLSIRIGEFDLRIKRQESNEFLSDIRDILNKYPSNDLQSLNEQISIEESQTLTSCSQISASNSRTSSRDVEEEL